MSSTKQLCIAGMGKEGCASLSPHPYPSPRGNQFQFTCPKSNRLKQRVHSNRLSPTSPPLVATMSAVGNVPVGGLALILGIDRFMSEARALTNVVGNGVAAIVVARWTGDLDQERMRERLG